MRWILGLLAERKHAYLLECNRTKVKQIEDLIKANKVYAICITETWLNEKIKDAEIKIENNKIFRTDRIGPNHRGICLYLRQDISAVKSMSECDKSVEGLLVKSKPLKTAFLVVYRPGGAAKEGLTKVMRKASEEIDMIQSNGQYPNLIVLGDFNFRKLKW